MVDDVAADQLERPCSNHDWTDIDNRTPGVSVTLCTETRLSPEMLAALCIGLKPFRNENKGP